MGKCLARKLYHRDSPHMVAWLEIPHPVTPACTNIRSSCKSLLLLTDLNSNWNVMINATKPLILGFLKILLVPKMLM
jgi:hypothetical protein